jgi:hypothetical protein
MPGGTKVETSARPPLKLISGGKGNDRRCGYLLPGRRGAKRVVAALLAFVAAALVNLPCDHIDDMNDLVHAETVLEIDDL